MGNWTNAVLRDYDPYESPRLVAQEIVTKFEAVSGALPRNARDALEDVFGDMFSQMAEHFEVGVECGECGECGAGLEDELDALGSELADAREGLDKSQTILRDLEQRLHMNQKKAG